MDKMHYNFGKGKRIIFKCKCDLDNSICKIDDKLNGSCRDSFVILRDFTGEVTPEQCLKENLKSGAICRYAKLNK